MKLLIYTPRNTQRVQYIFSLFFKHLAKVEYEITTNPEELEQSNSAVLNYSKNDLGFGLWIGANKLLQEIGISDEDIEAVHDQGMTGAFPIPKNELLKFDPFSSAFYLCTRYEEYLPHLRDKYDRFDAQYSFAFKHGFLRKAMINHYALFIFNALEKKYPDLKIKRNQYEYLNTIDIDNAYAYIEKGIVRTAASTLKDVLTFDLKNLKRRLGVMFAGKKDPYDNYDYLFELQEKYKVKSLYFFLLADYGLNDKNVPVWSTRFQTLIKSIADRAQIGIHPSFGSNKKPEKLSKEIERLAFISKFEIHKSRQHFLILNLPETYRRLIENEIKEDYSMGFATEAGFRASICTPYPFYDLDREEETKLMIYPFTVMEATLKFYMELSKEEACQVIDELIDETKNVGGQFVSLWHNETVSDEGLWKGWRSVYDHVIKQASS